MIKRWNQFNTQLTESSNSIGVLNVNDDIDFDVLTNLKDERGSVREGDTVIATYFLGGYDTYMFVVEKLPDIRDYEDGEVFTYAASEGDSFFAIDDAYHIVKKETYDDFVGPENQLNEGAAKRAAARNNSNLIFDIGANIEKDSRSCLLRVICDAFVIMHEKYHTISGDADFTEENLLSDEAIQMMSRQVMMNMDLGSIMKLKTDNIDLSLLKDLTDERGSIEKGDRVIVIVRNTNSSSDAIRIIEGDVESSSFGLYVTLDWQGKHFLDEDTCLYVIKKETYEDFGGKLKYQTDEE